MPRQFLPFALAALLVPAALSAQEPAQPQEPKPATQEAQPPAKTPPDAFHYFFGKKDKDKKDGKDAKDEKKKESVAKAEKEAPAKKAEPAAAIEPAVPAPAVPEPQPQPQPEAEKAARPAPRVDAFQYFFGKSSQPAPKSGTKKAEPAEKKPVDAFDYLFGKKSKEAAPAEPKDSAKPPGL
ncbi:MAG: hypothetical protein WAM82_36040 [Thermoanaerobaculia bacterium]